MSETLELESALQEHFGFDAFRPGQREVVGHLMAGRSAAAVFPTGAGKSLCYQMPALMLEGVALVVSPLIALMKDQIDALGRRGIAAARLDSTLDVETYRQVMQRARAGDLRLLYVAPERFANERFIEAVTRMRIGLFAVDEAHCISEWGHNFRPDYLKLPGFARRCGAERVLALTATATERVLEDICAGFEVDASCVVRTGFYRPNLTLLTTCVEGGARDGKLIKILQERAAGPTIVYVTLQRTAEQVARTLTEAGLSAKAYHAGMETDQRTAVQEWFLGSEGGIVVATIAFGMGIDKADIRYVYHYNLPKSLENYAQEVGRAGRDGEPATCEILVNGEDLNTLENFVYGDTPDAAAVHRLVRTLNRQADEFDVSFYALANECDIKPIVARTLLTYLELDGLLVAGTPFYSAYRFRPLMSSAQILQQFEGERREFLRSILSQARRAQKWFTLDVDAAAGRLGEPRDRVVRALDYLGERNMLEVTASGVRHRFSWRERPEDEQALAETLVERVMQRERSEIARLEQVLDLVAAERCQTAMLCEHFAETRPEPCGHCSYCLTGEANPRPQRPAPSVDEAIVREAVALRRGHPEVLGTPRGIARLLCGVTSPRLSRAKLTRHPLFASLSHVPFDTVVQAAAERQA